MCVCVCVCVCVYVCVCVLATLCRHLYDCTLTLCRHTPLCGRPHNVLTTDSYSARFFDLGHKFSRLSISGTKTLRAHASFYTHIHTDFAVECVPPARVST